MESEQRAKPGAAQVVIVRRGGRGLRASIVVAVACVHGAALCVSVRVDADAAAGAWWRGTVAAVRHRGCAR